MQKIRIMPTLLYKDTTLVKGISFDSWRRVGSLIQSIRVYNMREVDELVFLDITATEQKRSPDFRLVDDFADDCFMPLTVGGGITSSEDVRKLLNVGADKIALNTAAYKNPELISQIARKFGAQCVIVSIDYKYVSGIPHVFINSGKKDTGIDPVDFAKKVCNLGAGEIILTSIERDGLMVGYDVNLLRKVADAVDIPVIASGGAGQFNDFHLALKDGKASAVAAASMFHFTENTPLEAKRFLAEKGYPVRL